MALFVPVHLGNTISPDTAVTWIALLLVFCPLPHCPMSTTSQTVAQHSTERQMYKPIVIRNRRWWQPWKQDSIVNLALLARWSDLRCDLEKLTAARAVLEEDFAMLQSQHQQARRTIIWRAIEKVKWAAEPTRVKPRGIPGLSLELGIIAAHALVIGAYAIV